MAKLERMNRLLTSATAATVWMVALGLSAPVHAICAAGPGDREPPATFVGIALGKDVEVSREPSWPHRFRIEEIEWGLDGFESGEVIDVALAVTEYFEGGMAMSVSVGLGDAPLVGGRYRVGVYSSEAPEGVRYHANACGGFLERLPDPEGADPYRQILPTDESRSDVSTPELEVDAKAPIAPLPRPATVTAGIGVGSVSIGLFIHARRRARALLE